MDDFLSTIFSFIVFIFELIIFVIESVFRIFNYFIKKVSYNQKVLLTTSVKPVRVISSLELDLLSRYLTNKELTKPYKHQKHLFKHDVFIVEGTFEITEVEKSNTSSCNYKLNGLDVILPYDIQQYILVQNHAEVVFTNSYALVLSLNGMSLSQMASQSDINMAIDIQWKLGNKGELGRFFNKNNDNINNIQTTHRQINSAPCSEPLPNSYCELILQRQANDNEHIALPTKNNLKYNIASFISIICLLFYYINDSENVEPSIIVGITAVLLISIIFNMTRKNKTSNIINQIKTNLFSFSTKAYVLNINNQLELSYPEHWQKSIQDIVAKYTAKDIIIEADVFNRKITKFGGYLSIEQENIDFGKFKNTKNNIIFSMISFISMAVLLLLISSGFTLKGSLDYNLQLFKPHSKLVSVNSNSQLNNEALYQYDWLNATVQIHCDIDDLVYCQQMTALLQQYPAMDNTLFDIPKVIMLVIDKKLIQVSPQERRILARFSATTPSQIAKKNKESIKVIVVNSDDLINGIDKICQNTPVTMTSDCQQLQQLMMKMFAVENNGHLISNWDELVMANKTVNKKNDYMVLLTDAIDLENQLAHIGEKYISFKNSSIYRWLRKQQKESIAVAIDVISGESSYYHLAVDKLKTTNNISELELYNYYKEIALNKNIANVNLTGMITDVEYYKTGDIKKIVLNEYLYNQYSYGAQAPAAIVSFYIIVFTFMGLLNFIIWCCNTNFNRRRLDKLQSFSQ